MIEINKYKLDPSSICLPGTITTWGAIIGDITKQQDLVDYVAEHGGGSAAEWGSITGDISDQTDLTALLSEYATQDWVEDQGYLVQSDLSQYATRQWVTGRGYITSDALNGYATESWVASQGYLTEVPSGYATESFVTSALSGYATEDWVSSQMSGYVSTGASEISPLYNKSEGYLKYVPGVELMGGMTAENETVEVSDARGTNVYTINGEVYLFKDNVSKLYKFNEDTFNFDYVCDTTGNPGVVQPYVMWADSQGRVYYYNQYKVDLTTGVFTSWSMGGDYQMHNGTVKSNLIQKDGVTYLISRNNSCAYIFNEQTQLFDSSIPITGTNPSTTFYRYLSEFDGHWIYDAGSTQTELVFHLDVADPYLEWVTLDTRLFPGAWTYTYDGSEINETTRGVFVHPVTINGVTDYYTFGYANPVMYKLVNGAWEIVDFNIETTGFASNAAGCTLGDLLFGYGYYNGVAGVIIWNMNSNAKMSPDFYGWDDSVDTRLSAIESSLDSALSITNEILS